MRDAEKGLAFVNSDKWWTVDEYVDGCIERISYWITRCQKAEAALREIASREPHKNLAGECWVCALLIKTAQDTLEEAGK